MTTRQIPAVVDCIGCRHCYLQEARDNRSILRCGNPEIIAMPVDVSACFEQDQPEGGEL